MYRCLHHGRQQLTPSTNHLLAGYWTSARGLDSCSSGSPRDSQQHSGCQVGRGAAWHRKAIAYAASLIVVQPAQLSCIGVAGVGSLLQVALYKQSDSQWYGMLVGDRRYCKCPQRAGYQEGLETFLVVDYVDWQLLAQLQWLHCRLTAGTPVKLSQG